MTSTFTQHIWKRFCIALPSSVHQLSRTLTARQTPSQYCDSEGNIQNKMYGLYFSHFPYLKQNCCFHCLTYIARFETIASPSQNEGWFTIIFHFFEYFLLTRQWPVILFLLAGDTSLLSYFYKWYLSIFVLLQKIFSVSGKLEKLQPPHVLRTLVEFAELPQTQNR